jgi:two-component system catabolic regulation response regulator CreB
MSPPRILLIEDEAAIADTLLYALAREGMQVQWCRLARDGEALLAQEPVDLLILDVGLPDASGMEVLRRLRQPTHGLHALPVMLLTARSDEIDRVIGLELGADDYVVKPFSPREVAARIKTILRRVGARSAGTTHSVQMPAANNGEASPAPVFQHDLAGLRIRYHGSLLALTPSEYRLLVTLLDKPGRVFSRAQLLDALGDAKEDNSERTVDSHVRSLRAKLRAVSSADDPVQTHRGFGYCLNLPGS